MIIHKSKFKNINNINQIHQEKLQPNQKKDEVFNTDKLKKILVKGLKNSYTKVYLSEEIYKLKDKNLKETKGSKAYQTEMKKIEDEIVSPFLDLHQDLKGDKTISNKSNLLIPNPNYEGKLSPKLLASVMKNYDVYKNAAKESNVPWEMLAAIHYRENSLVAECNTPGGPFQFDPPGRFVGENDFKTASVLAGNFLQGKVKGKLTQDTQNVDLIKDAFWGYNGRAYGSFDKSPYVMNGFDENHQNMRIKGSLLNKNGERIRINTVDKRLGAFTIYHELKKAFVQ